MIQEYRVFGVRGERIIIKNVHETTLEIDQNCVFDVLGEANPPISLGQKVYLSPNNLTVSLRPLSFRLIPLTKSLLWDQEKLRKEGICRECAEIRSGDPIRGLIYAVSYLIRENEEFRRENRRRLERILGISGISELNLLENVCEKEIFDPFQWLNIKSAYQSLVSRFKSVISASNPCLSDENSDFPLCSKTFNLHIKLKSGKNSLSRYFSSGEMVSLKVRMYIFEDWTVILLPKEGLKWDKLWHMVANRENPGENDSETEEIAAEMRIYEEFLSKLVNLAIKCTTPTGLFLSPEIRTQITSLNREITSNPQNFRTFPKVKEALLQLERLEYPCSSCSLGVPYLYIGQVLPCGCILCLSCSETLPKLIPCLSSHH